MSLAVLAALGTTAAAFCGGAGAGVTAKPPAPAPATTYHVAPR